MPSPAERFLDAAVRPFSDNPELQIHARRELEERIDPASTENPSWDSAAERLQHHDRKWWRGKAGFIFLILILVAFFTCFYPGLIKLIKAKGTLESLVDGSGGSETHAEIRERISKGMTMDQRLILFGTSSDNSGKVADEELWQRHPDNPCYLAGYARAYTVEHGTLPPDYLETAARIDPDNGWFPAHAATILASRSVKAEPRTEEEKKARKPKQWKILDPAGLDQAVALLVKARSLPLFESYTNERFAERIALLPPANDFGSYIDRVAIAARAPMAGLWSQKLIEVIGPQAQRLAEEDKKEELHDLLLVWKDLNPRMLADSNELTGILAVYATTRACVGAFREAARRLDLGETSQSLEPLYEAIEADYQKRPLIDSSALEELADKHGNMLSVTILPVFARQANAAPVIDGESLKPIRLFDHAWGGRLLYLGLFSLMGIAAGCAWLYRFRHGRLIRLLSARVTALMTPADWIWILLVGGCGPLLAYEAIQYLTPLGMRDWGFFYILKMKPSPQLNAWGVLTFVAPIAIARWRLGLRTQTWKLKHARPWLGWSILFFFLLLMPLVGLAISHDLVKRWEIAWTTLFVLGSLWWHTLAIRALCTRRATALARQATARLIAAAYGTTMLALAVAATVTRFEERYWLKRDTLMQVEADKPGFMQFEYQVGQVRKSEVMEILSPLEEIR
ncbi:hypothetical protein KBB96_19855 [Luteolibacter ambystomatis]|uniref:Uncharacterized protein n=1 Tax=Luteolibacter ambystomatis TaxID=2824561 RepID=A0A975G939_9BACT|nr:hypothetical protein [Luteolibacter ambystomatis]QUE51097.1 hypothetical protein KBB96_19855 [Luteolibacter ambystomatis]